MLSRIDCKHRHSPGRRTCFLLDTNVFIEAHRRYYALDLCPGFWECLSYHARQRNLSSIDKVQAEIREGDALSRWIRDAPDELFVSSADPAVANTFKAMMAWVQGNPQFRPQAESEFAVAADGWLAAYAKVHGAVLVTQETADPNTKRRVPLPNVCDRFGVVTRDTFAMLRELEVRFDWRPRR